jgi:ATP citrate (pro-S)-lyase
VQVRKPTNVVSTICDDRGEEPTYYGVTMSQLIEEDYGIGDVLALLWFKRKLPKYFTKFMEMWVIGWFLSDLLAVCNSYSGR